MTETQIQEILTLLQGLDTEAIMASIDGFIKWALGIVTAAGLTFTTIQARYNKAKLALESQNFLEAANTEKATMLIDETKSFVGDMATSFQKVTGEHEEAMATLVTDNKILYDMMMAMLKGGMVNSDVLMEMGAKLANVGDNSLTVTQEFVDAMAEAEFLAQEQESILDK